ncbi:MAG: glycerophosphodiester phosphodiesterase family protein [Eubacteriales bacterium]
MKTARLVSAVTAAVLTFGMVSCSAGEAETQYPPYTNPEEAEAIREDMRYIIHAAGRLTGVDKEGNVRTYDGSNSMEGLRQCADAGCEVIEIDFNFTADGYLACIHDWYTEYADEITNNVPLTLDEFLSCKIYRNFTPIWLGDIVDFLEENEGTYIVTDIKDDNIAGVTAIAAFAPELKNRFIVQIYDESEYDAVRELGFEYVIYTLYRLDWNPKTDWRALGRFAETHPLLGFTFSYELCSVDGYVEGMLRSGVPLYIHTVNGDEEQQPYFAMGITGIYTDDVK